MSWSDMQDLATAINAQKAGGSKDLNPGELLCVTHLIAMAVNPDTGEILRSPKWVRAPGTNGPNDEGNPLGLSSDGMCQQCWIELHSGSYHPCPVHGIQPVGTRDDGQHVCPVCGKTTEEARLEVQSAVEARAPAVLAQIAKEDEQYFPAEPVGGVPPHGLERQHGVLENPPGPGDRSDEQSGTATDRTRPDGEDPQDAAG